MEPPECLEEVLESLIETEGLNIKESDKAEAMLRKLKSGNKVCLLKKALYGLRQAGRNWYSRLGEALIGLKAVATGADPCVFRIGTGSHITLIAVYVDDLIIASRDLEAIKNVKRTLASEFVIRDIGPVSLCLGIEFTQTEGKITMCQKGYINDILHRFGMSDSNPVTTPMDVNVKLQRMDESSGIEDNNYPYRELMGALMYLAVATRPDIAYPVSCLSQFNNCYTKVHWTAAKRILRYIKGTKNLCLVFKEEGNCIEGFVDADWGNCPDDRHSYGGYAFCLSGSPISWDARKQRTVALSSTESEYMALAEAVKEAIYLQNFVRELGFNELDGIVIMNDNFGAKQLAENPVHHARTKHIDIKYHFVREALKDRDLKIEHIPTDSMAADIFTKGLSAPKHKRCIGQLGLEFSQ